MYKIIVVGAGGHAAEIDEYVAYNNRVLANANMEIIGFLDDNPASYERYRFSAPFLGGIRDHQPGGDVYYLMGIANLAYRRPIIDRFVDAGARFITLIHATAYVSPSATIGVGVTIAPFVNVGPNTVIGQHTLLNSRCSIGHDTRLGQYNFICPNVAFSGFTVVGDNNLFGINSATIPGITVGNDNKIAAGMTLDKNVGDGETVFYRFKEKVIAIPQTK